MPTSVTIYILLSGIILKIVKIVIFDQNSAFKMTIETIFEQVRQRLVIFGITFNPFAHSLMIIPKSLSILNLGMIIRLLCTQIMYRVTLGKFGQTQTVG